jgi:uncharacterized membrane protein (UPF0127 family)
MRLYCVLLTGAVFICLTVIAINQSCLAFSDSSINNPVDNGSFKYSLDKLSGYKKANVTINRYNISAFVADTDAKRIEGLSGIENIAQDQGMLFILDYPSKQGFWMKEMKFPLDIIWVDNNNTVVHVEKRLQPCTSIFFCPVFTPLKDAKFVLETRAGFADSHSVKEGTRIVENLN